MGGIKLHNRVFINLQTKSMLPMAWIDMVIRVATYKTAYETRAEELLSSNNFTPTEIHEQARSWAEEVNLRSQNPSQRGEMGLFQTEGGPFVKSLAIFSSQPFANMKTMLSDVMLPFLNEAQKSGVLGATLKIATTKKVYRKVLFGAMLPGMALGALGRRRPQKNLEEVLQDMFVLGIGNQIPILGQAIWFNAVMGYGDTTGAFAGIHGQFLGELTKTLNNITATDGKANAFRSIKSARRIGEALIGVPDWPIRVTEDMFKKFYIEGGSMDGKTLWEAARGYKTP